MSIKAAVRERFLHPLVKEVEVDHPGMVVRHRQILEENRWLKSVYDSWYQDLLRGYWPIRHLQGEAVEIGCGPSFLKTYIPELIPTDVVAHPFAARAMDAMHFDFPDESLKGIFLISVLHHIPQPEIFLQEACRCLKPGGKIFLIEPNRAFLEVFLGKVLSHYEYWNDAVEKWENRDSGRLTHANIALPWVIFIRDRALFEKKFPRLKIRRIHCHTFLSYFISGGFSFKPFLPFFVKPLFDGLEWLAKPLMKRLGCRMTIELEKV